MKKLLGLFFAIVAVEASAQYENNEYLAKVFYSWLSEPAQSNIKEPSELRIGSVPTFDELKRPETLLDVSAAATVNGKRVLVRVMFNVYSNNRYSVASGPFFSDYKSPDQIAKEAAEAEKLRQQNESPLARYLRTGNKEEYDAVMAKQRVEEDAAKQKADAEQAKLDEEARKVREQQAAAQRTSIAASRLFIANWKNVSGNVNTASSLNITPCYSPSELKPNTLYDVNKGPVFRVFFSKSQPDTNNSTAVSKGLGALTSLVKVRVGNATLNDADNGQVRDLNFNGLGTDDLNNLMQAIEKYRSWAKTAADNKVTNVQKELATFGNNGSLKKSVGELRFG